MKKKLTVILALVLVLSLAACGGSKNSPEGVVSGFCDSLKTLDAQKMQAYLKDPAEESELGLDEVPKEFMDILKTWAKDLKYKVGKAETNGDNAKVKVDFTYTDASEIFKTALTNYISKAMAEALSGNEVSEEKMTSLLVDCIKEAQKSVKTKTADISLDFELEKVDGNWKISNASEELANVMLSNMLESFGGLFD